MTPRPRPWTIADVNASLRSGIDVREIVEDALGRLEGAPSGVLIGQPLAARARADAAALVEVDPATRPLYGIPFVVKDNIDVEGETTTIGCPGTSYVAVRDATVVATLRAAGAIVVGKTNLDQFATGLVGTRSPYGTPPNAIDQTLVPGGSSSGSAVAVALGLVPFSLGTDTAGSGRVPAALNGIVGIKPTLGSASTHGIVPAIRRLDCPSVFANDVADAAAVARLIRHADPVDPYSREAGPTRAWTTPPVVAVPAAWPSSLGLDESIRLDFERAVERLVALGTTVVEIDIAPALELGRMLYGSSLVAERAASVGEAVRAGVEGLDPTVTAIIERSFGHSAIEAYRTEYELATQRAEVTRMWSGIDALALPTTPIVPSLERVASDPLGVNEHLGRFTTFANLADLCCVVVPTEPGRPYGLQLLAPAWQDENLALLARGFATGCLAPSVPPCTIVVVGAHLEGLVLNHQLAERGAKLVERTTTASTYRLHALAETIPPKPGLERVAQGGAAIEVEVWSIGVEEFGSFVNQVPPPLTIGTLDLADGSRHKGFLCEPIGLVGATDITSFGGWRSYLASR